MKLFNWIGKVFSRTHEAYCVKCKSKTMSKKTEKLETTNSKGTQVRLYGRCVDCNSKTSIITAT